MAVPVSSSIPNPSSAANIMASAPHSSIPAAQVEASINAAEVSRVALSVDPVDPNLAVSNANPSLQVAEKTAHIGLQMSSGVFVDFSTKLTYEQKRELIHLLSKFGGNTPGFTIDLEELKDGNKRALSPLPGQSDASFTEDMSRLRELANFAIGSKLYFKRYPLGHRTCREKQDAFSTGHSKRLEKLQFERHHLEQRLDQCKTDEEKRKVLATHMAAKGLMSDSKLLLEAMKGSQSIGRDIEGESRKKKIGALEDRVHQTAVLYGATHLLDLENSPDIQGSQKQAKEFIESFSLSQMDREAGGVIGAGIEGLTSTISFGLIGIPFRLANKISEENEKQENTFADQLVLLGLPGRENYEYGRAILKSEERSDGPELFFVQLADLVANSQNDQDVLDFMNGPAAQIAFGNLDPKDKAVYQENMTKAALQYRRILSGIDVVPSSSGGSIAGMQYLNGSSDSNSLMDAFDSLFDKRKKDGSSAVLRPQPAPVQPSPSAPVMA